VGKPLVGWVVGPELSVVSPRFERMDDITGSMDVTGLDAPGALAVAVGLAAGRGPRGSTAAGVGGALGGPARGAAGRLAASPGAVVGLADDDHHGNVVEPGVVPAVQQAHRRGPDVAMHSSTRP
jgi:hypothetical protein